MELLLTVVGFAGFPPERPASLRVGAGPCTIGRSPGSDLPLPDPERLVSGLHARIELRADGAWIADLSTNGTFLNRSAERLAENRPVQLHDGDILGIGPYEIAVAIVGEAPNAPPGADPFACDAQRAWADPRPDLPDLPDLPGLADPGRSPDILDLLGGAGGAPPPLPTGDPFPDAQALGSVLDGPARPADPGVAAPAPTPVERVYLRLPDTEPAPAPPPRTTPAAIPDNYNLLGDLWGDLRPAPDPEPGALPGRTPARTPAPIAAPAPRPDAHTADPVVPDTSPDDPFGQADAGAAGSEPVSRRPSPVDPVPFPGPIPTPGAAVNATLGQVPERSSGPWPGGLPEGTPQPGSEGESATAPAPTPAEPRDASPQRVRAPTPPPAHPPGQVPDGVPAGAGADAGLVALLAGLGTGDPSQVRDPQALLHNAGALLRALTAGLAATMLGRARFKSELRLGMTVLTATENNPFKFSVSPEEALERLLLRPSPGYLPPLDAAREAFEDIQAHEMAIVAGLRGALRALLARFEPSALEARLDPASGLDKLLPMARRSRYWEQFTEEYERVAADAEEDFMDLFGEAFTRAYEDQVHRLAQARGRRASR